MSTPSITLPTAADQGAAAAWNSATTVGLTCPLDSPVQPRYFCGQLLTDADLTALVDWTQDRLRLARFPHGWGVVCGLAVHKPADAAKKPGYVTIEAGYARGCCGDDIIVPASVEYDLSKDCPKSPAECEKLLSKDEPAPSLVNVGGEEYPADRVCAVDLYVRYAEKKENPQTALGRSGCRDTRECEHSRNRESYSFAPQVVKVNTPPRDLSADYQQSYTDWLAQQAGDLAALPALFQIMQNYAAAPVITGCHHCKEDYGVPLARIWLLQPERPVLPCQVLAVDSYPPYRRHFMVEPWPAPTGKVNLARFLWYRWRKGAYGNPLYRQLADLGLHVAGVELVTEADEALTHVTAGQIFCRYDTAVTVLTADMGALGERVIGFGAAYGEGKGLAEQSTTATHLPTPPPTPDDLTQLRGIKQRSADALAAAGITQFAQIAAMTPAQLRELMVRPASNEDLQKIIDEAEAKLSAG